MYEINFKIKYIFVLSLIRRWQVLGIIKAFAAILTTITQQKVSDLLSTDYSLFSALTAGASGIYLQLT